MDQARELRNLINVANSIENRKKILNARVITVSSGKGGVGKSSFSVNLAIYLAKLNKRVVVIDADFGLANIEVLLGVRPKYNFYHILKGEKNISEILVDTEYGIKLISGGSGLKELSNVNNTEVRYFIEQFDYLDKIADIIIIDTGAGISSNVTNFIRASDENIIVTTPEPTSFTDAYTLIKIIKEQNETIEKINVVINKADDNYEADRIFKKLSHVCQKFLNLKIENIGYLPTDVSLIKAVKQQKPVLEIFPNSEFTEGIKCIGNRIINEESIKPNDGVKSFIQRLMGIFSK